MINYVHTTKIKNKMWKKIQQFGYTVELNFFIL